MSVAYPFLRLQSQNGWAIFVSQVVGANSSPLEMRGQLTRLACSYRLIPA
jgi:hypothetical protein